MCLAVAFLFSACTSVQWRDAHGVMHHAGLVACKIEAGERGTRMTRYSLGVDVRLSGEEPGITLGWKQMTVLEPRTIEVQDPLQLPQMVADYLAGREPPAKPRKSHWRFFFFEEEVSRSETVHDTYAVGAECSFGTTNGGMGLGYRGSHGLVGRALDDGIVQVAAKRYDHPHAWELTLWTLGP